MSKILTVTANPAIDRAYFVGEFQLGQVHRPLKTVFTAGGKGVNVTRVCRLLDSQVIATGFLGGYTGTFVRSELCKIGVEERFTQIAGETRLCINVSDANGVSTEVLESGPEISPAEAEQFMASFEENISACDVITVSGSLPVGLTPEFYLAIADVAKRQGKKIIFDTSGALFARIVQTKPYMVKPNKDEFMRFAGWQEFEPVKALKYLAELGVEVPIISLGKDGAVAMVEGKGYKFSVPSIECVSAVGSGDSTVAGIATGLVRGMPVCDAIRLGMASGITNALFPATGFVTQDLVKKYYQQVTVSELND